MKRKAVRERRSRKDVNRETKIGTGVDAGRNGGKDKYEIGRDRQTDRWSQRETGRSRQTDKQQTDIHRRDRQTHRKK